MHFVFVNWSVVVACFVPPQTNQLSRLGRASELEAFLVYFHRLPTQISPDLAWLDENETVESHETCPEAFEPHRRTLKCLKLPGLFKFETSTCTQAAFWWWKFSEFSRFIGIPNRPPVNRDWLPSREHKETLTCGSLLFNDSTKSFHPPNKETLEAFDKLLQYAAKHIHTAPPKLAGPRQWNHLWGNNDSQWNVPLCINRFHSVYQSTLSSCSIVWQWNYAEKREWERRWYTNTKAERVFLGFNAIVRKLRLTRNRRWRFLLRRNGSMPRCYHAKRFVWFANCDTARWASTIDASGYRGSELHTPPAQLLFSFRLVRAVTFNWDKQLARELEWNFIVCLMDVRMPGREWIPRLSNCLRLFRTIKKRAIGLHARVASRAYIS